MGAPEHVIANIEAGQDDDFEVWDDNWEVLCAFLCVSTQWRAVPGPSIQGNSTLYFQGLDYASVDVGLRGAGVVQSPDLWRGLRVMEAAARNALNGIREFEA